MTSSSLPASTSGARALWMVTLACLAWTLVSWLANGNLDGYNDMLENYAWSQPLQLGTHKHPPFFAWVVGLWFMVFPQSDGFYRLLSYANVGVGIWGVYVLGRRLGLVRLAPLGAALLLWCFPYTTLAGKFNANSQLLSLWPWAAALLLASWQEKGLRGLAFSLALGVVSAACMLSKYYSGVFLAGFLLPIFLAPAGRQWLLTSRPYVALLAFGLALAPHVAWIAHHHWVTLGYAMDQGGGRVVWGYVLRFALSPIFYWLPAWLAVCLVYGFMQARRQGGGWLRWSARFLRRSWAWQGRADVLFWLALMPWLATLAFGIAGVVELSTPWAIPIGYAFVLLWLRNLDIEAPAVTEAALAALGRAWWPSLAVVALVGLAVGWGNARKSGSDYYRPSAEAAQAIVQSWSQRHPGQALQWVGGDWAENAMLSFYAQPHLRTVPGLPHSEYARVLAPLDWQHQNGLLLCPRGPASGEPGPTAQSLACERQARDWLEGLGLPAQPRVLTVQRSGWRFPLARPYAYAVFDVLPRGGGQPADNAGL
ncbi:Predicted membrane protein [Delftia tsuruhatensis]|uniref:glycosyltransferase family 39 protein n=1 Tax=Delftia tsuruhatensis TaxID=180282 RepID=UPI001E814662|nr:glycosyltransferase family 39 protein [Delftia tsuruhatensis]CAB5698367.1 Predicted membrane protein [Delftia tsuruhatensis]CAC9676416.1 Predicted membrane protein [Delftia tsuruhatensis]